jgi:uncharacterized protein HemX
MSWIERFTGRAEEPTEAEALEPALKRALGDFKASVHAWSDAVYNQPRALHTVVVRRTWRLAAGLSLASVLLAGTVSGGLYEHHRQVQARIAAEQEAQRQREIAAQQARERVQQEEDMFASVDKAISREVPAAMEPLAALTDDDTETK